MNYCIRRIDTQTARIAFELTPTLPTEACFEILRIRTQQGSSVSQPDGVLLQSNELGVDTVVVNAEVGDMIVIRHKSDGEVTAPDQCYRIGASFVPRPIEASKLQFPNLMLAPPASRIETEDGRVIHFEDHDLKALFRGKHPEWLQEIVEAQLCHWREYAPATYVRLAPREWLHRDVFLVAIHDPYRALLDFKDRLTQDQLAFAIRRLPSAAVRFAFDKIPRKLRSKYLSEHANYILENNLQHLANSELRICSWKDPLTAFKLRSSVLPRRSAIILSSTYTVAWIGNHGAARLDLRQEILSSLLEFPEEWLKSNTKGLEFVFKKLKSLLGIQFDDAELRLMLKGMHPKGREALSRFIAQRI